MQNNNEIEKCNTFKIDFDKVNQSIREYNSSKRKEFFNDDFNSVTDHFVDSYMNNNFDLGFDCNYDHFFCDRPMSDQEIEDIRFYNAINSREINEDRKTYEEIRSNYFRTFGIDNFNISPLDYDIVKYGYDNYRKINGMSYYNRDNYHYNPVINENSYQQNRLSVIGYGDNPNIDYNTYNYYNQNINDIHDYKQASVNQNFTNGQEYSSFGDSRGEVDDFVEIESFDLFEDEITTQIVSKEENDRNYIKSINDYNSQNIYNNYNYNNYMNNNYMDNYYNQSYNSLNMDTTPRPTLSEIFWKAKNENKSIIDNTSENDIYTEEMKKINELKNKMDERYNKWGVTKIDDVRLLRDVYKITEEELWTERHIKAIEDIKKQDRLLTEIAVTKEIEKYYLPIIRNIKKNSLRDISNRIAISNLPKDKYLKALQKEREEEYKMTEEKIKNNILKNMYSKFVKSEKFNRIFGVGTPEQIVTSYGSPGNENLGEFLQRKKELGHFDNIDSMENYNPNRYKNDPFIKEITKDGEIDIKDTKEFKEALKVRELRRKIAKEKGRLCHQ